PRLVAKITLQQLADIFLVDPCTLLARRRHDDDSLPRTAVVVERRFHREPGAEQRNTLESALPGLGRADFNDAEHRHLRARRELVEYDMRRIRRHRDEIDAGARQALQRLEQVFAERETIGRDKVKRPLY